MRVILAFGLLAYLIRAQNQVVFGKSDPSTNSNTNTDTTSTTIAIAIANETLAERTDSKWNCTLRGWVRAPDLSPSQVFPGEARLAANGSECGDIVAWAVGLRLKERAIVKLKSVGTADY